MKTKKIVSIVLMIFAVVAIGLGIYMMNSSKYIFERVLSKGFDYINNIPNMGKDFTVDGLNSSNKYKMATEIKVNALGTEMADLTGDIYWNNENYKYYMNLDSNISGEEFIGFESYMDSSKIYFKIKEAMEEYYYDDVEIDVDKDVLTILENMMNIEINDIEIFTNHLKNSILEDMKESDFKKTSQTLNIESKKIKTTKITYAFTDEKIYNLVIKFLEKIGNDPKAIEEIKLFNEEITSESIKELVESLKESKNDFTKEEYFYLNVYTKGFGNIVRTELTVAEKMGVDLIIACDTIDEISVVTISADESSIIYKDKKLSKDKSSINLEIYDGSDTIVIKGTLKKTKSNIDLELELKRNDQAIGTLNYDVNTIKKNKEYKEELNVSISDDALSVSVIGDIYLDEEIPAIDVSGAVNVDDASAQDKEDIEEYLNQKLESVGLSDWLGGDDYYADSDAETGYSTSYYEEIEVKDITNLIKSDEPVVIWFGQQTCLPCIEFSAVLNESWVDYWYEIHYIDIAKLNNSDINYLKSIDSKLSIQYTPTVAILQDGKVKEVKSGAMTQDEYYAFLDKYGIE